MIAAYIYIAGFLVAAFVSGMGGIYKSEGQAWRSLAVTLLWPVIVPHALAATFGSYFAKARK